jgi:quinol monooxygenase YgiN
MISVIARLTIEADKVEKAIGLIKDFMEDVGQEEGTLLYTLNQDPKKIDELVIIERYTDKSAFSYHSLTGHFKRFNSEIGPLLAAKPVISVMEEIHTT